MFDEMLLEKAVITQPVVPKQRRLDFKGAKNFRDLGGYRTVDGRTVRWGLLYRSDSLNKLTDADLRHLSALCLDRVVDFRALHETEQEPDRLPVEMGIQRVGIPILDSSTGIWHNSRDEFIKNIRNIDPAHFMIKTNTELATRFVPEFMRFFGELKSAEGRPVLFHCTAGKDRTGFAAAVILRLLGVPQETVMEDYLLSNEYFLGGYKWKLVLLRLMRGKHFVNGIKGFMIAHPSYLGAAFDAIDREHGSFENYVRDGLGLSEPDVEHFKMLYLE